MVPGGSVCGSPQGETGALFALNTGCWPRSLAQREQVSGCVRRSCSGHGRPAACSGDSGLFLSGMCEVFTGTAGHGCAAGEGAALRVRQSLLGAPAGGSAVCVPLCAW